MEGHDQPSQAFGSAHHRALCRFSWQVDVSLPHPGSRGSRDDGRSLSQLRRSKMRRWMSGVALLGGSTALMLTVAGWTAGKPAPTAKEMAQAKAAQIARGRFVIVTHD